MAWTNEYLQQGESQNHATANYGAPPTLYAPPVPPLKISPPGRARSSSLSSADTAPLSFSRSTPLSTKRPVHHLNALRNASKSSAVTLSTSSVFSKTSPSKTAEHTRRPGGPRPSLSRRQSFVGASFDSQQFDPNSTFQPDFLGGAPQDLTDVPLSPPANQGTFSSPSFACSQLQGTSSPSTPWHNAPAVPPGLGFDEPASGLDEPILPSGHGFEDHAHGIDEPAVPPGLGFEDPAFPPGLGFARPPVSVIGSGRPVRGRSASGEEGNPNAHSTQSKPARASRFSPASSCPGLGEKFTPLSPPSSFAQSASSTQSLTTSSCPHTSSLPPTSSTQSHTPSPTTLDAIHRAVVRTLLDYAERRRRPYKTWHFVRQPSPLRFEVGAV
ncbi:hypothetical protein HDZ31DRAFT_63331 [Schizophyllum fasciatum]